MESDGYVVFKGAMSDIVANVSDACDEALGARERVIFNSTNSFSEDRRRSQAALDHGSRTVRAVRRRLSAFLQQAGYKRVVNDMVCILSKPGCAVQPAHCDFEINDELLACTLETIPLLAWMPLGPGDSTLVVWPGSFRIHRDEHARPIHSKTIRLSPGDLVLFRADLVHAGSGYSQHNRRLHAYADSSSVTRPADQTWFMGGDPRIMVENGEQMN